MHLSSRENKQRIRSVFTPKLRGIIFRLNFVKRVVYRESLLSNITCSRSALPTKTRVLGNVRVISDWMIQVGIHSERFCEDLLQEHLFSRLTVERAYIL